MISKTMCVLFSESYSAVNNELAAERTLATVPFAGRYRLIDFVLSSLVKAGVNDIGILTKEHCGQIPPRPAPVPRRMRCFPAAPIWKNATRNM